MASTPAEAAQSENVAETTATTAEEAAVKGAARSPLSEGLMLHVIPVLDQISIRLIELENSQKQLLQSFKDFDKLKENPELDQLQKLPAYLTKVRDLRGEMAVLQERSGRLAKKAIKMQRRRQEDEIQEEIERRKYAEQEKQLAAKVVDAPSAELSK